RHEIGISIPARHDMEVHVVGNAGARYRSLVHTHVIPLWLHGMPKRAEAALCRQHDIGQDSGGKVFDTRYMQIRRNHEMAVMVGVKIHQDKTVLGPVEEQVVFVSLLSRFQAKDASLMLLLTLLA